MTNQLTLRTIDLPTFHRHAIGFDRLFNDLTDVFAGSRGNDNYPPYNIIRLDETHYAIEVAVAGFSSEEIEVELKENILRVRGQRVKKDDEPEYLHKGISNKSFERTFTLAENVEVRAANVKDGVLAIALEQIVPEEKKLKKIPITFSK